MRLFFAAILLFIFNEIKGQTYEIGLFAGGTNNIGDVGRSNFILPSGPAFGGLNGTRVSAMLGGPVLFMENLQRMIPNRTYRPDNNGILLWTIVFWRRPQVWSLIL